MSGGGIEREREGAWEQGREGNFKGGSIFTNQPFTNRPLPLRLGAYAMAWTRCITGNPSEAGQLSSLYYKRGEPYLCSAKAPVLDGSGSRR